VLTWLKPFWNRPPSLKIKITGNQRIANVLV
jgi:hypothetical protein